MKHAALILALAVFGSGVRARAHEGHEGAKAGQAAADGQTRTIDGKIVDLACYLGHGAMSDEHTKCAKACVLGGAPAGVLAPDGNLFLLVEDHGNPKPYGALKKLAGEQAKVTGRVARKGGLQALVVSGVEKAK